MNLLTTYKNQFFNLIQKLENGKEVSECIFRDLLFHIELDLEMLFVKNYGDIDTIYISNLSSNNPYQGLNRLYNEVDNFIEQYFCSNEFIRNYAVKNYIEFYSNAS